MIIIQIYLEVYGYFKKMNWIDMIHINIDFNDDNIIDSFEFKDKITGQTGNNRTRNVEMMVLMKYLSNFWRVIGISLINYEMIIKEMIIQVFVCWFINCLFAVLYVFHTVL